MGKICFIFLVVTIVYFNVSYGQNYCNIDSCGGNRNRNTLCLYNPNTVSPACTRNGNFGGGLSQNEKNAIVSKHNELRQRVASGQEGQGAPGPQFPARYMPNLQWDTELEAAAQAWANQCQFDHDPCRNVPRFSVGQNIFLQGAIGDPQSVSVVNMVQGWYNEVKDYNRNDVHQFTSLYGRNGQQIGHYTQFVWANTNRIGCGSRNYRDNRGTWRYLVCNYGPAGNVLGQPVYQTA